MPTKVTIHEAKTNLSQLIRRVEAGDEIVIARGDEPVAVLTAYKRDDIAAKRRTGLGSLEGRMKVPPDDVLIGPMSDEDLAEAFGDAAALFK